jgi:hypothetical protein
MAWQGRWAIISQDEQSIFEAGKVAFIPFDGGFVEMPWTKAPAKVVMVSNKAEKPFTSWQWKDGKLKINAEGSLHDPWLNGFVVYQ